MATFERTDEVAGVAATGPFVAAVLARHGIDPRSERGRTMEEACAARALDWATLRRELAAALGDELAASRADMHGGLADAIDYVVGRHHAFARRRMAAIDALLRDALRLHGAAHPNVFPALAGLWERFSRDFATHMRQEEEVLFPAVRAAAATRTPGMRCGNLDGPVLRAEWMHDEHGTEMAAMRRIAGGFLPPAEAGETWRALYAALDEFDRDLREHVRIENDVIFPRVRALDLRRRVG